MIPESQRTGPPIAWFLSRDVDRGIGASRVCVGIVRLRLGREGRLEWFNQSFPLSHDGLGHRCVTVAGKQYVLDDLYEMYGPPFSNGDLRRLQKAGALKNQPDAIVDALVAHTLVEDDDDPSDVPF